MQIVKRTVHRRITEEEMIRLKSIEPFATYRQDSKPINFGFIFGMSYVKFSKSVLETNWKHERILAFIKEKGLYDDVEKMAEKYPLEPSEIWDYYSVSNYLRTQFFESYPGLMKRIRRNEAFAKENGYVRSFHGAIRRTPMLMLCMNEEEKVRPDENKKEYGNLVNITSNSTIQSDEVVTVMSSINKWIAEGDDRALVHGTVHDSIDFYVEKQDAIPVLLRIKEIFEHEEAWQKGLKFPVDITVCDINAGDYYKHGMSLGKLIETKA